MKVLVLNCGSSTLKFQLIDTGDSSDSTPAGRKLARGVVDRIGADSTCVFEAIGVGPEKKSLPLHDHEEAVHKVIEWVSGARHLGIFDALAEELIIRYERRIADHGVFITREGVDPPEITDWKWGKLV